MSPGLTRIGLAQKPASVDKGSAAKGSKAKAPPPKASTAKATFVGSEVCGTCHEDIGKALSKSPHGAIDTGDKHGFKGQACESCHGPGSNHVESLSAADIRNPAKMAPAEVDKTCLTCHRNQPTQAGRLESSHARNAIACTSCHSIHGGGPVDLTQAANQTAPRQLVARKTADINTQCEGCHIDVKAAFTQPFKHRVPEGAMSCVDCHNPHGSFKPGNMQMASANEPGCYQCHGDKRGPFTFEHPVVREEGCQGCHEPHGSQNAKMLNRQEVRLVCLECHANLPALPGQTARVTGVVPPAFHDLTSPRFRNCTVCHQKIHGSHVDRNLLR
ncbi:MAG TPA: DmsE family decaheme c-type cytochrome [Bryobacteraceae bacterium]|nr:DmsE family decaheme c-type cytochrome [Bryobacteraceae bacterium]